MHHALKRRCSGRTRTISPVQQRPAAWTRAVRRRLAVSARDHWLAVRVVIVMLSPTAGGRYSCTGTAGNTAAPCGEESKYSTSTRGHLWRRHAERLTRVRSSLFCGSTGLFETLSSLLIGLYCVHTPMSRYYPRVARVDVWHSQNSRIYISH